MASSSSYSVGREVARAVAGLGLGLAQEPKLPIPHVVSAGMLAEMGIPLNVVDEKRRLLCIAYRPTTSSDMYGTLQYRIWVMLRQEDDPKRVECLLFCVNGLEVEDGVQAIIFDNMKGGVTLHSITGKLNKEDAQQLGHMLVWFTNWQTSLGVCEAIRPLAPHKAALEGMSLKHSIPGWTTKPIVFCHHPMGGPKNITTDLGKQALLDEAGPNSALVDEEPYKKSAEIVGAIAYLNLWMGDHPEYKGPAENYDVKAEVWAWASPPAVVPRSNGGPPLDEFTNPGDWPDCQVNDGLSMTDFMSRKNAAKMRRT